MDADRPERVVAALREFLDTRPAAPDEPERHAIELFHRVVASVPAYRDFLRANEVDPDSVRTFHDFRRLPLLSKENYHHRYPLPQLCRNGRLDGCDMIAVSSGSTGRPTFWPRFLTDELGVAARFERVFADSFRAAERSTLAVVCFPLGTWVGGLYTAACVRHLAAKGYPITVVAPGNNKAEILRVIPELAPHVDQVVLLGYPPFVKDVIDSGLAAGVEWARYAVKLVLAGEVFTEEWRELVGRRAGMTDPDRDSAALYGTADAGVLGNETPLSVRIRRFLAGDPTAARELFGESRLPTLVQYDPTHRFFETHEGTLLFSGDNGVPLIRYHIADEGGLVPYEDMLAFCARHGFDPVSEADETRRLPFAYVFGRSLFTVSYFGANIYPENVAVGLEQPGVSDWVTGKFVLQTVEDSDSDRRLRLVVELAPGEEPTSGRERLAAESVRDQLLRLNSEFAHYVPPDRQLPHTILRAAGDPEHFPVGVKHRYTRPSG
ncbi:phenylacetate--CoA ligase family protein [Allosalinactinospora lopnorensis]|uniref:phenylacetate--CoA ligase family protein n=1 Tax=Allosalinactinospora lopnorensis TaxID=1352348 RepID=UPI000623C88F|nr:phenylacetate--CoA ligase family protein [Allosalinactinospora lopnorensis]